VPPSPYLPIIYKFADAMLERGRATNGVFYSALDRTRLAPLTNRPPPPTGVQEQDRVGYGTRRLVGSNADHDQNLLRLLYTLSDLSGKPKYREAADAELRWFMKTEYAFHRANRPWMLWERCFGIASGRSQRRIPMPPATDSFWDVRRDIGFYIRAWVAEHQGDTNQSQLIGGIDRLLDTLKDPVKPAAKPGKYGGDFSNIISELSLAIDCDAASRLAPEPHALKWRSFAEEKDRVFCALPHDLRASGGFITANPEWTGGDRNTPLWIAPNGGPTTAQVAMMCVSRYENTGNVAYRDLVHAAADLYLESMPPADADVWAMTLGQVISLQVAAWRSTAKPAYLSRAGELADFALRHFFDQGPLPRASLKSNHYEAITGADTLALGLVELHLHILGITAVRYPPNTIDR
jgi:hypothetical protein